MTKSLTKPVINLKNYFLSCTKPIKHLTCLLILLFSSMGWGQITSTTYDFSANATGWTGTMTRRTTTTSSMCGSVAMRQNLYSAYPTGSLISPLLSGTNNLGLITLTYKYRASEYYTYGAVNPWGYFNVQVGNSATGPWTTVATVSQETQTGSCITKTHTFSPPSGSLYIKWDCFWTAGDYFIVFDDIAVSQGAAASPCSGTPTPGTIASNTSQNLCSGVTPAALTVTGTTSGVTGITYQWEDSSDNATWANATGGSGATAASYTPPAFGGTTIYYRCKVTCSGSSLFDVTNVATIAPPVNPSTQASSLAFSSVSYTGFTASWTNGNGNRRVVYVSDAAITDPTNNSGAAAFTANTTYSGTGQQIVYDGTGASVSVTGLALGTTYNVKVIEYTRCSSGPYDNYFNVSSGTNSSSVTTTAVTAVPWNEGFATTTLPSGWLNTSSLTISASVSDLNPALATNYMYVNLYDDGYYYYNTANFSTPIFASLPANYRLVFDYKINNYGLTTAPGAGTGNIVVAISTNNGSSFTTLQTINNNGITGWQNVVIDLSTYANQNIRLKFTSTISGYQDYFVGFDNFSVEATPSCLPPNTLVLSSVTNNSASLSWTASASAPGSGYEVYYSTTNTAPLAGTTASASVASGTTYSFTGLTANTTYFSWVRSNCGSGDLSTWAASASFTTLCTSVSSFPIDQGFNTSTIPSCWSQQFVSGSLSFAYPTSGSYPTVSTQEGSNMVYYNSYSNSTETRLVSLPFNSTNQNSLDVEYFWYHSTEGGSTLYLTEGVTLQYSLNGGATWSSVGSQVLRYNAVAGWKKYTVTLPNAAINQSTVMIGFLFKGNSGYNSYLDNVSIKLTPNTWTGTTSTSWSTASNWSLSTVPTASDDVLISSNGSYAPVMDVDVTIPAGKSLRINSSGTLTIAPGKVLTIAGTANFGGKAVTFKSDATGTAMLGTLTGTLTNATNVKVERYIPSGKRAFRLLSPAVTTTTFISGNWQGQTHITGGASGGFDVTETNNPSMFTYNNQVASGTGWTPIANTNATNLTAGVGYRMLVRGDRNVNLTVASQDNMNAAITLSATGTLRTGTVTLDASSTPAINNTANTTTANYSLVGNPYQSAVDWHLVTRTGIEDTYYAWAPNMGTGAARGNYVAYNVSTGNSGGGSVGQFIQPGQAFFVKNTVSGTAGTLTFEEADKASTNANVFRTANQTESTNFATLSMQLYDPNELAIGGYPIDATKAVFGSEYTNELGLGDATKLEAAGENIAWFRNNTKLAIDAAAPVTTSDELVMKTLRLGANKNYTFKIQTTNFDTALTPYLVDTFLNTQTEIATSQAYLATFATTSNVASYNENRFKIVFQNAVLSTDTFATQIGVYPNPSKGNGFYLQLPATAQATVRLYNTLGQEIAISHNEGHYQANQSLAAGVYHIMVTQGEKTSKLKWIVE